MELQELKEKLKLNNIDFPLSFIFCCEDYYLPLSYISYIKDTFKFKINYINEIKPRDSLLFDDATNDKVLNILISDKLDITSDIPDNTIIITKKLNNITNDIKQKIITFPKIENWQIQDYVKELGKGITGDNLNWLLNITNYDIYRITSELSKLSSFPEKARNAIFELLKIEGNFNDLTSFNIFSLSNCIVTRDIKELLLVYRDINCIDINPIGLITILYNNFKNISAIQLGINITAESLNISSKQFMALKYRVNKYKNEQLITIIELLSDIDYKLKAGVLPADMITDYVILKILNVN